MIRIESVVALSDSDNEPPAGSIGVIRVPWAVTWRVKNPGRSRVSFGEGQGKRSCSFRSALHPYPTSVVLVDSVADGDLEELVRDPSFRAKERDRSVPKRLIPKISLFATLRSK